MCLTQSQRPQKKIKSKFYRKYKKNDKGNNNKYLTANKQRILSLAQSSSSEADSSSASQIPNILWNSKYITTFTRARWVTSILPHHFVKTHFNFHNRTVHLDIIKVFYLPTDAQENCFKNNTKIYFKTAPTCFGAITIIRECIIWAC